MPDIQSTEEVKQEHESKYKIENDKLITHDLSTARSLFSIVTSLLGTLSPREFEQLEISFSIKKKKIDDIVSGAAHVLQKPKEEDNITQTTISDKLKKIY